MRLTEFEKRVRKFAAQGRPTVAFGFFGEPDGEVLTSVRRGLKHAKIVLLGCRKSEA